MLGRAGSNLSVAGDLPIGCMIYHPLFEGQTANRHSDCSSIRIVRGQKLLNPPPHHPSLPPREAMRVMIQPAGSQQSRALVFRNQTQLFPTTPFQFGTGDRPSVDKALGSGLRCRRHVWLTVLVH